MKTSCEFALLVAAGFLVIAGGAVRAAESSDGGVSSAGETPVAVTSVKSGDATTFDAREVLGTPTATAADKSDKAHVQGKTTTAAGANRVGRPLNLRAIGPVVLTAGQVGVKTETTPIPHAGASASNVSVVVRDVTVTEAKKDVAVTQTRAQPIQSMDDAAVIARVIDGR